MILGKTTLGSKFYAASYYVTKSARTKHKSSEHCQWRQIFGAIIDKDFNYEDHITGLEGRVARSVGILPKLVHRFPQNIMLQLCHALVHPLILYGMII